MQKDDQLRTGGYADTDRTDLTAEPMPRCPGCGWQDVRRSRTRSPLDNVLGMISLCPFRCRSCGRRFYRVYRQRREE